jgi:hypothetical protein
MAGGGGYVLPPFDLLLNNFMLTEKVVLFLLKG